MAFPPPGEVSRIASIGAGPIGGGWSAFFLARGYDVCSYLHDPAEEDAFNEIVDTAWTSLQALGLAPGASRRRLILSNDLGDALAGAQFVHFLLGPATVALAVPLYENRKRVAAAVLPMLVALAVGSLTAIVSVVLLAKAFGLPRDIILSLAPKSVTAGVAMGISESLHADPSLTAVSVILTGIMGAIIVTPLMNFTGITDYRGRGFAAGIAAHGIGTARAFQVDEVAGVFAGIAMSLNALVTSLLVPLAVTYLLR